MNELQKCAEILVECGYAKRIVTMSALTLVQVRDSGYGLNEECNPFANTLEGRRQIEAIYNHYYGGDYRQEMIEEIKERLSDEQSK